MLLNFNRTCTYTFALGTNSKQDYPYLLIHITCHFSSSLNPEFYCLDYSSHRNSLALAEMQYMVRGFIDGEFQAACVNHDQGLDSVAEDVNC